MNLYLLYLEKERQSQVQHECVLFEFYQGGFSVYVVHEQQLDSVAVVDPVSRTNPESNLVNKPLGHVFGQWPKEFHIPTSIEGSIIAQARVVEGDFELRSDPETPLVTGLHISGIEKIPLLQTQPGSQVEPLQGFPLGTQLLVTVYLRHCLSRQVEAKAGPGRYLERTQVVGVIGIAGHQLARQVEPLGRVVFHIPSCIDVTPVLSTGDLCFGLNFHLHVETLALLMAENDAKPGLDGCLLLCRCRYGKQDEYNPPMCCL